MLTAPGPSLPGDRERACPARADESGDTGGIPALPGEQAALDALVWNWGEAYEIGCEEGQWWFRRKDGKGGTETASGPDELRALIVTDYTIRPVRRPPADTLPPPGSPAP
jgi:hypothetical protein